MAELDRQLEEVAEQIGLVWETSTWREERWGEMRNEERQVLSVERPRLGVVLELVDSWDALVEIVVVVVVVVAAKRSAVAGLSPTSDGMSD